METNITFQKDQYLINEFLMFSLNAGLQTRNPIFTIYKYGFKNETAKQGVKRDLKDYLVAYTQEFNNLTEKDHYNKIEYVSKLISENHSNVLLNGRFRIGVSQKIINLFLKYMWTIGKINMPYHCPFDSIIKTRLLAGNHNIFLLDWTELDSIEEYKKYVFQARIKANDMHLSIAEWELFHWNNK